MHPDCDLRSSAPFRARLRHLRQTMLLTCAKWSPWLMSWCLLMLSACSSTPVVVPIDPPPPELAAPCDSGPSYPDVDVGLLDLLEVVRQRESAAADCRARHRALVGAWPR